MPNISPFVYSPCPTTTFYHTETNVQNTLSMMVYPQTSSQVAPPQFSYPYSGKISQIIAPPEESKATPKVETQKNEDSFDDITENKSGKVFVKGISYEARNVYKSLIRHIFTYIRKNRNVIVGILIKSGYAMSDVEHAFYKINCYNELERERVFKKRAQATIRKMISKKTIYTYILKETLNSLLQNWNVGKLGKISKKNSDIYKDVCEKFLQETIQLLGECPIGNNSQEIKKLP